MEKDQGMGWLIVIISLLGLVIYYYLVFMSVWSLLTVKISAFFAVSAMLIILAWIGYTFATTPPPMPLEDSDFMDQDLASG